MDLNHSIVIPQQWFVGLKREPSASTVPFASMVPNGTDAATKKKIQRVEYWASRRHYGDEKAATLNTIVLDNKPMSGFRISKSLRRLGWNNKSMLIRVEDPRGFEAEISVSNLIMIIDNNLLHNGEIVQPCVWGRDGQENKLLPINSIPYVQAVENTERTGKKISVRSVKKGDTVILHNGIKGIYMGSMYAYVSSGGADQHRAPTPTDKKRHVVREVVSDTAIKYHGYSAIKISEVLEQTPKTEDELFAMYTDDRATKVVTHEGVVSGYYNRLAALMYDNTAKISRIELKPIAFTDIKEYIRGRSYKAVLARKNNGPLYKLGLGQFSIEGDLNSTYTRTERRYTTAGVEAVAYEQVRDYMVNQSFEFPAEDIIKVADYDYFTVEAVYLDPEGNEVTRFKL